MNRIIASLMIATALSSYALPASARMGNLFSANQVNYKDTNNELNSSDTFSIQQTGVYGMYGGNVVNVTVDPKTNGVASNQVVVNQGSTLDTANINFVASPDLLNPNGPTNGPTQADSGNILSVSQVGEGQITSVTVGGSNNRVTTSGSANSITTISGDGNGVYLPMNNIGADVTISGNSNAVGINTINTSPNYNFDGASVTVAGTGNQLSINASSSIGDTINVQGETVAGGTIQSIGNVIQVTQLGTMANTSNGAGVSLVGSSYNTVTINQTAPLPGYSNGISLSAPLTNNSTINLTQNGNDSASLFVEDSGDKINITQGMGTAPSGYLFGLNILNSYLSGEFNLPGTNVNFANPGEGNKETITQNGTNTDLIAVMSNLNSNINVTQSGANELFLAANGSNNNITINQSGGSGAFPGGLCCAAYAEGLNGNIIYAQIYGAGTPYADFDPTASPASLRFPTSAGAQSFVSALTPSDNNNLTITQNGTGNLLAATLAGSSNTMTTSQTGNNNMMTATINGVGNTGTFTQVGGDQMNVNYTGNYNTINAIQPANQIISTPITINTVASGVTITASASGVTYR